MWNFRLEIISFKPIKKRVKKHQLLYAVYMQFILQSEGLITAGD